MKKTIINQVEAIALLKDKKSLSSYEVRIDSTPIEALDALLLRKNGISVPDELIWYDDTSIDYSDIPEWTDEELKKATFMRRVIINLPLDEEVRNWVRHAHFDFTELLAKLITDFYNQVQSTSKAPLKSPPKKGKKKVERTVAR
jgi:hypothetical protein